MLQRRADARRQAREATRARWRQEAEAQAERRAALAAAAEAEAARQQAWIEATPTPSDAPEPAAPSPPPRAVSPEAALLERVIARLRAVQADHPRLLADVNLARLVAGVDGPLAVADDRTFAINTRHPTAAAAMRGDDVAEIMLVAAAYAALNLWLEEITHAHELRFIEHLLALASGGLSGESARS